MLACSNCRPARPVYSVEQQVECLTIHEGAVLQAVEAGAQGVLDPLGRAAVAGHLAVVVVALRRRRPPSRRRSCRACDGRRCRARRRPRWDRFLITRPRPWSASAPPVGLVGPVDQQDQALHAELEVLGFQSISPPAPQISRPLAASEGRGPGPSSIAFLQPDVDVMKTAAATGRRVAAFERQPGIARRQGSSLFDRVLDIEIRQLRRRWKYVGWKCASTSPGRIVPPGRRSDARRVQSRARLEPARRTRSCHP